MLKSRHRRIFALAVALCTTAFVGLSAVPASAHAPVANEMFNPDEHNGDGEDGRAGIAAEPQGDVDPGVPHGPGSDGVPPFSGGDTKEAEIASDAPHEVGTTYPLRSVSFTDGVLYEWWNCDDTAADEWTSGQCTLIASDTTPEVSVPPFLVATVNAWSGEFDIPAAQEGSRRHIRGVACQSDYTAGSAGPTAHCTHDTTGPGTGDAGIGVEDMHYDDSSSTADHGERTIAGRIWALDFGACLGGAVNPCTDLTGDDVHGALVPNDGFTIVGFSSDPDGPGTGSTDADAMHFCLDLDSDPNTPNADNPNGTGGGCNTNATDTNPDDDPLCTSLGAPFNLADCWTSTINPPDTNQFAVSMIEYDDGLSGGSDASGSGDCEGDTIIAAGGGDSGAEPGGAEDEVGDDCQLDKIYLTSQEAEVEQVHLHNEDPVNGYPSGAGDTQIDVGSSASGDQGPTFCQNANRAKDDNVPTNAFAELHFCAFDQFADIDGNGDKDTGRAISVPVTMELSGSGDFVDGGNCDGNVNDVDGDGLFESCTATGSGFTYEAEFTDAVEEAVTVTACFDGEANTPANPDYGCADETLKDTLVKNFEPGYDHVHLRFAEDVTNRAGPSACHTGAVSKTKGAATTVPLVGCVQDANHQGAAGIPVIWRVIAGIPAQFLSVEQTTDADGTADASITAPGASEGSATTLRFCVDFNNNGVCDSDPSEIGTAVGCALCHADVQITWTKAATPGGGCNKIRGSNGNDKLKGTAGDDCIKGRRGDDKLRGKAGADLLKGGPGFDICKGGPGSDRFRGCEVQRG